MAEIRTVTTLRAKADEIRNAIIHYERKLTQAKADMAHVIAAIAIFEASGDRDGIPKYVDVNRLFKNGEIWGVCKAALAADGPLDTRALGLRVMKSRGLNAVDGVLAVSVNLRVVHALRLQEQRGKVVRHSQARTITWALP
jgi:hypothetical protein